ncbi:MAG: EAL domain-containing protein [Gammaproteobacteria bacterium]|nr:EAL domain-containing protein [Gammaproteobacteria bacterium]
MTHTQPLHDVYVGRQPIFTRDMQVYAYELLFRHNQQQNAADVISGDSATAQVVMNAFIEIGLSNLVGQHKAFLNFTEQFLLRENHSAFPTHQLVIELLETIQPTPAVINATRALRDQGYTIALDDFFYTDEFKPLIALAHIIKIDILAVGIRQLPAHVQAIRASNADVRLLAEKVETNAQFELCKALGMDYFQGYFFARPQIVKGQGLANNKLAILNLLSNVYDPDIDMGELAEVIGHDVGLTHKLLAFVRSYPGNESIQINSIKDAVLRFGLQKLQSWVSILVLAGKDDKTPELFKTALIRARFVQLLAEHANLPQRESFFMVGLFSCLDALMDADMPTLMEAMPLHESIKTALIDKQGVMGEALSCVLAIEQGKTAQTQFMQLNAGEISSYYMQAMWWATIACANLSK